MLLTKVVADVAAAALVLNDHLVTARAAIDDPVQESGAIARHTARLVAIILCIIVAQHVLDLLERVPADVGRVLVPHHNPPLLARKLLLSRPGIERAANRTAASIDEGPRIGRVLQHRQDGRNGRGPPDRVAEPAPTRDAQTALVQDAQHLVGRADPQEGREDQLETRLHLAIRVLDHHAADLPHEAGRKDQCKLTAGCLVQETRCEARPNGVQLDFGDRALEPEQQASIRSAGIIDTVSVGDQTILVTAEIEQRIPVRAIACQTRDLGGEHDTDLSKRDTRDQILEALPVVGGGTAQSEVGVDDLDVLLTPPKAEGAPAQIVLQPQALLVRQHLVRAGLANIDDRAPGEMPVGDELRSHGSPPRGSRRGPGRSRRGVRRTGLARRVQVGPACRHPALLGQGDQLLQRLARELAQRLRRLPRSKARRRDRQLQHHALAVGDEGVAVAPARADRDQRKAATKERMRRISDLDLDRTPSCRVVEGGINRRRRSTGSTTTS